MVAIPGFYDKAEDRARRFEVEDLTRLTRPEPVAVTQSFPARRANTSA